ncbi:MAG TPA: DMT family transporter [Pyrinomonadaceae bacterium]|nr:DMT family transporter [Pyrinomonadaceae bacterium]
MKIFFLTVFALTAFAFNSILCRMALATGEIDPASFTAIRLVSGTVTLVIILLVSRKIQTLASKGSWVSAFFLFAYAIAFSFAYLGLTAGTGALILFGSVQLTMFGVSLFRGERPGALEWVGLLVAFSGLVYLVLPGLAAPPPGSAALMVSAGIAWGFYTLRGKGSGDPLADTAGNFLRSVPIVLVTALMFFSSSLLSMRGAVLAAASGAIASGIGYSIWYAALKYHTPARAGILQLSVPIIASVGGVLLLAETTSIRLSIASAMVLGGIGLTLIRGRKG